MSSATKLLDRATRLGAEIWVDGGRLEVKVPAAFPETLVSELRLAKPELVTLLTESQPTFDEPALLAWAAELAEGDLQLDEPVRFVEAPLRVVATSEVSGYIRKVLRTLSYTRANEATGGYDYWPKAWWTAQTAELIDGLRALREAIADRQDGSR